MIRDTDGIFNFEIIRPDGRVLKGSMPIIGVEVVISNQTAAYYYAWDPAQSIIRQPIMYDFKFLGNGKYTWEEWNPNGDDSWIGIEEGKM